MSITPDELNDKDVFGLHRPCSLHRSAALSDAPVPTQYLLQHLRLCQTFKLKYVVGLRAMPIHTGYGCLSLSRYHTVMLDESNL